MAWEKTLLCGIANQPTEWSILFLRKETHWSGTWGRRWSCWSPQSGLGGSGWEVSPCWSRTWPGWTVGSPPPCWTSAGEEFKKTSPRMIIVVWYGGAPIPTYMRQSSIMRVKGDADRLPDSIRSNWVGETEEYISSLLPYLWDLPQSAEGCHARHWLGLHLLENLPCVGKIEICISFIPWSVWSPLWSTGRSFRLDQTFGLVAQSRTSQENCIKFKTNQWKDQKHGNTFAY